MALVIFGTAAAHATPRAFTIMGDESPFRSLPRDTSQLASDVARPVRGIAVLADERIALLTQGGRVAIVGTDGRVTDLPMQLPGGEHIEHMDLAAERAGSLLVALGDDLDVGRVFRVRLDGTVALVAGARRGGTRGGSTSATSVALLPRAVHALPDGGFLLAEGRRIRRVAADGTLSTIAGSGRWGRPRAGRAIESPLEDPSGVAALPGGDVIFTDGHGPTVWRISANGTMRRVAGGGRRFVVPRRGVKARSVVLNYASDLVPLGPERFAIVTVDGLLEVRGTRIRKVVEAGYQTPLRRAPVWSGGRLGQAWVYGLQAAARLPSGGWLLGSDDGLVMTTRPDGAAKRLAVAVHTKSLAGAWRQTVTVASSGPARASIVARAGGRRVASARAAIGRGLTRVRLGRELPPGLLTLEVVARSAGASASHRLRVLGRPSLPQSIARRAINRHANASGGDILAETDRCRRRGPRSVRCRTVIDCECGAERYTTTISLGRDGWLWGRYNRQPWFRLELL